MMENEPYSFVMHHTINDLKVFKGFAHRTFNADDVAFFIEALRNIYKKEGGLEMAFHHKKSMEQGLIKFRQMFLGEGYAGRTAKHIADVKKNASVKRLNMFLRWMVRNDKRGVDFGIWKNISPALLYCPLDLHSGRVARKLGLLKREQDDWQAVMELTNALRKLDPKDPIKYDFALFGLGAFEKF